MFKYAVTEITAFLFEDCPPASFDASNRLNQNQTQRIKKSSESRHVSWKLAVSWSVLEILLAAPGSVLAYSRKSAWSSTPGLRARLLLVIQEKRPTPSSLHWSGLQRQWKGKPDGSSAMMQALSSSAGTKGKLAPKGTVTVDSNQLRRRKQQIHHSR